MLRRYLVFIGLLAAATLSAGGCRSCSNCHDYGPPVANCHCNSCGCHRAGSASDEHIEGEYAEDPFMSDEGDYSTGSALPAPQTYDEPEMGQPESVR
jgi:hypothetical protein